MGILRAPPSEAEVVAIDRRYHKLKKLTSYPEWEELKALAVEDKAQSEKRLFRDFTNKRSKPIDQRLIDRHIGFWEGVESVLASPDKFARKAQQMLDTAVRAQQEGDT